MEASISMYADDHQIYAAGDSSEGVEKKLLEDGERMTWQDSVRIIYGKWTVMNIKAWY